ncbi:MAG: hypothetical protein AAF806_02715 [Bacteroidota bacterium]
MNTSLPEQFQEEFLFEMNGFTTQLCCSPESKELAFQLRYQAYSSNQLIQPNEEEILKDIYDERSNSRTHLLWHEGIPVASVRSSIWSAKYNWATTESIDEFYGDVATQVGLGYNILESCRFSLIPELKGRKALEAQLILFRVQDMSARFDECQHIITAVRSKHTAFYERMLGFQVISAPKKIDWIEGDIVLLASPQTDDRYIFTRKGMPLCTAEELDRYALLHHQMNAHVQ